MALISRMAVLLTRAPLLASQAFQIVKHHRAMATAMMLAICLPPLRSAYLDYRGWYALGAGGLPHNVFGWLIQSALRLRATNDVRDTLCFDGHAPADLAAQAFLDPSLPPRDGIRPRVGLWVLPHRQLEQGASRGVTEGMKASLRWLAKSNPTILETGPSILEGHTEALFLRLEAPQHASVPTSPKEIFHTHGSEGSSHGIFSAADAKTLIEKGWAERHPIAGRAIGVPLTYLMLYAPRSEAEVDLYRDIAKAAASYCSDGKLLV